jgi:hypothetical protein
MKAAFQIALASLLCIASLQAQNTETLVTIEYDGSTTYATNKIEPRFMGEYVFDKGKSEQHFILKIDASAGTVTTRNKDPFAKDAYWDANNKKRIEWLFLSDANGKPVVMKVQEFSDGEMKNYPAMVFLYRYEGETIYHTKMLTQRDGNLFLDEAVKQNNVASANN